MRSPDRAWLLRKELHELTASRAFWLLLLATGALVAHAFSDSLEVYAQASGAGGGAAALAQGLNPLDGIIVPTLGAYDLVATLLLPFVVIRLFAIEKQTGALPIVLQLPGRFSDVIVAKAIALLIGWMAAGMAGALAIVVWRAGGGHVHAAELWTVALGHLLRGFLTIGIGAAAAAISASAASAAILALAFTIGTWAVDYIAAGRGGVFARFAEYTPEAALRVFERGELRAGTVTVLLLLGFAGLVAATIWMREGVAVPRRARAALIALLVLGIAAAGADQWRWSHDTSEDRRNSFAAGDERVLRAIRQPLTVTAYLAAEDPRLADLERGVLAKLRRTMPDVRVVYAASERSEIFAAPGNHYGEVWYELGGRREMLRSTTEPIVLEVIYKLAGVPAPAASDAPAYPGYPLATTVPGAGLPFFAAWFIIVCVAWWLIRRPRSRRPAAS
ncbi:MAG: hypothetical protein JWO05_1400 [Gemmatimonadetes bacterium]|nr:hypothetical protein [Gemmatimonadota bacterium]